MKKLSELFEIVVNHFKKDSPERHHQEVTEVEESESHLSRSGKSRKKPISQHPFRRFWRRYHLTKIVLILGLGFGLVTGGYLFYVAKSTNVNDLQNALKATTAIYDKDGKKSWKFVRAKGNLRRVVPD